MAADLGCEAAVGWVASLAFVYRVFIRRRNRSFTGEYLKRPLEHLDRSLGKGDKRAAWEWPLTSRGIGTLDPNRQRLTYPEDHQGWGPHTCASKVSTGASPFFFRHWLTH